MTDVACMINIDTEIDANTEDISSAATWLSDLQDGFRDAMSDFTCTAFDRSQISGDFGDAVDSYVDKLYEACSDADSHIAEAIDVINSWADQVSWRKDDMASLRDDAVAGGLAVRDDRYIDAPQPVGPPGKKPSKDSQDDMDVWKAQSDAYDVYVDRSRLFSDLQNDAEAVRQKLRDWADKHMTIESDSPVFELFVVTIEQCLSSSAETVAVNAYYGVAFDRLVELSIPKATARAAAASGNPARRAGKVPPNPDSVARRASASAVAKAENANLKGVSKTVGKVAGTAATLAIAGWEIYSGSSPSTVVVETLAGVGAAALVVALAPAEAAGAVGAVVVLTTIAVSTVVTVSAGYVYESVVPLQVRERIDEGVRDAWNWAADKVTDGADWVADKAEDAWDAASGWVSDRWHGIFG